MGIEKMVPILADFRYSWITEPRGKGNRPQGSSSSVSLVNFSIFYSKNPLVMHENFWFLVIIYFGIQLYLFLILFKRMVWLWPRVWLKKCQGNEWSKDPSWPHLSQTKDLSSDYLSITSPVMKWCNCHRRPPILMMMISNTNLNYDNIDHNDLVLISFLIFNACKRG